jgi:hypothetical protein
MKRLERVPSSSGSLVSRSLTSGRRWRRPRIWSAVARRREDPPTGRACLWLPPAGRCISVNWTHPVLSSRGHASEGESEATCAAVAADSASATEGEFVVRTGRWVRKLYLQPVKRRRIRCNFFSPGQKYQRKWISTDGV